MEVEDCRQYEMGMQEEIRRLQAELNHAQEAKHRMAQHAATRECEMRNLQVENTRLSNELIFLKQSHHHHHLKQKSATSPIAPVNTVSNNEILSPSDQVALQKIEDLVSSGADGHQLVQEAEKIMRSRRLTLHNLRQSRKMISVETMTSLKTLLDKVSQLERDLQDQKRRSNLPPDTNDQRDQRDQRDQSKEEKMERKDLLADIKKSSIAQLKKVQVGQKIHEIQDGLKAAIERHRMAMSERLGDDDDEQDEDDDAGW
jgi:hypothetical protein